MEGFLNPNQVLDQLELRENMLVAEFGCGAGGFAIPLAKKLPEGQVYAIDIQEEVLVVLKSKAQAERLSNIETILADLEKERGSTLPNNFLDWVLLPNLLFQAEDRKAVMSEAKRILKLEGKMMVVDWQPQARFGPPVGRVSSSEVKEMAEELGLKLKKEFNAGTYHYGLIFIKPD